MIETVHLKVPAKAENTLAVRLLIAGLANLYRFNSEEIGDLKLAVSEACAFTPSGSHMIDLAVKMDQDNFSIEIQSDHLLQKPMMSSEDAALSGIGFKLMQNLVDKLEYASVEGHKPGEKTTMIRLTKRSNR